MPHDVIMPALGMAQDTGHLVSWRKNPGDPISSGEALFEVETDKAVMEVEAQADGFLTAVSASAGDDIPVGSVIAVISESAETPPGAAPASSGPVSGSNDESAVSDRTAGETALPDGHIVIMPALGMAQDTGKLVAWRKNPGDAVAASEILFEVETDKSVMEVEAGHNGYLAACLALEGEDIPVGEPAAIISAGKPENPVQSSVAGGGEAQPARDVAACNRDAARTQTANPAQYGHTQAAAGRPPASATSIEEAPDPHGRILASPKAKRLALEGGLDLGLLARAGVPQPYHVEDLQTLRSLPVEPDHRTGTAPLHIQAKVPAAGVDDFISWMKQDGDIDLDRDRIHASLAAGALRSATQPAKRPLVVEWIDPKDEARRQADPDRTRLSQPARDDAEEPVALFLRDLGETAITTVQLGAGEAPVVTICRDADATTLCLDFTAEQLNEDQALAFMTELAARLKDPLRQLL